MTDLTYATHQEWRFQPSTLDAPQTAADAICGPEASSQPEMLEPASTTLSARLRSKYRKQLEAAARGELPPVPDLSAETHASYRSCLAKIVEMVDRRDIDGLLHHTFKSGRRDPSCSSARLVARYRDLCIHAFKVQRSQGRLGPPIPRIEFERLLILQAEEFSVEFHDANGCQEVTWCDTLAEAATLGKRLIRNGSATIFGSLADGRRVRATKVAAGRLVLTEAAALALG